ncbi:class A beta-lactamase-related serine hydrolase [Cellulomonas shaoxiangyii]|uniref:Class A beta-lactamase-related serine hydrolase n=1 Tax=Cellulomonas shaoxiangyii TaxID=2566013 RepID=A0A4P7SP95_9CELL|nr:class A beta-lactamase-related serine hydrolase [Cellulomonas shaoxiangyii]TGY84542.1 class A beta-lactamase-related serine hydrolase [Cellulomonas shaoxiangyii]
MDAATDAVRSGTDTSDGVGGVVARVVRDGEVLLDAAWGLADRRHGLPMTPTHRFATASGSKGLTALAVLSLVADGTLTPGTTARSLLGDDLPLVADDVTVEHLLAHRSGVGEYLDDDADLAEYLMPVPVHRLVSPEDYLPLLEGHPAGFAAGERFAYSNAGFVLLSLLAQRASGVPFHALVQERVLDPAGMTSTGYPRSDALPGDAAVGYVRTDDGWLTNVHHLPVVGGGDGGAYTTTADMERFWHALLGGRIVPDVLVARMREPRPTGDDESYGLGVWLLDDGTVGLAGQDTGVSFSSWCDPRTATTRTVAGTTADAAWPVARALREALAG